MITAEKIGIESSIGFESVYRMEISVRPNRHGKLFLQGILSPESEQQGENWDSSPIRVVMLDEHGKPGETIFHGILRDSYVYHENGVREVIVTALSGSGALDKESVSRTFQDVQATYGSLIRQKVSGAHGSVQMYAADTGSIQKPVIQYEETDWEFCRRMASHMSVPLYCNVSDPYPSLQIGIREEAKTVAALGQDYRVCVRPNITGGRLPICYEFTGYENYDIGDLVVTPSGSQSIYEKSAMLENGELSFTYRVCYPKDIHMYPLFNSRIAGVTLEGQVEGTEGENVYVKFDIDGEEGEALYPFPWTPVSGNIMYSMPEQGTKVGVYFGNRMETAASALACLRRQEAKEDDGKKKLQSPNGKLLQMLPGQLALSVQAGSGRKLALELSDAGKLKLESHRALSLYSQGSIRFAAPGITVKTPTELHVARTSQEGMQGHLGAIGSRNPATGGDATVMSMGQEYNFASAQGVLYGTDHINYTAFDDAPTELPVHTFSLGQVMGNLLVGLLVVAAVACVAVSIASVAFTGGATAALVPFIVGTAAYAVGALALYEKAQSDIRNQTNSPLYEYVNIGFRGAMAGGFAGAAIVGAAYTAPELAKEVLYLLPGNMPVTLTTMRWIMRGAYAATGGAAGLNLLFQASEAVEMASGNNTLKELMYNMLGPGAGQDTYDFLYMMTSAFAWYMIMTGALVSQPQDPEPDNILDKANAVQGSEETEGEVGSGIGEIISNLSKTDLKHSLNRHMPLKVAQQFQYMSVEAIQNYLNNVTFFNSNWTEEQISAALNYGYSEAMASGVTDGEYIFSYLGEIITIYLDNGIFKTGYGSHIYTYDEIMLLLKN